MSSCCWLGSWTRPLTWLQPRASWRPLGSWRQQTARCVCGQALVQYLICSLPLLRKCGDVQAWQLQPVNRPAVVLFVKLQVQDDAVRMAQYLEGRGQPEMAADVWAGSAAQAERAISLYAQVSPEHGAMSYCVTNRLQQRPEMMNMCVSCRRLCRCAAPAASPRPFRCWKTASYRKQHP